MNNNDDEVLQNEDPQDSFGTEEAIPLIIFNEEKRCKSYFTIYNRQVF